MRVYDDNSLSIGRTPLVRLNRVTDGARATMLAKIEGRNPAYQVKCRIGASMVWDAEKRGILKPGKELIEPTSGNTGIALAFVAAARGYPIHLTMPETMSRRAAQGAEGARRESDPDRRRQGHGRLHREGRGDGGVSDPKRFVMLQQFKNPANPEIHFKTTGPEIWDDTEARSTFWCPASAPAAPSPASRATSSRRRARRFCRWAWSRTHSPVITQHLAGSSR